MSIGFLQRIVDSFSASRQAKDDEERFMHSARHKDELVKLAGDVEQELDIDLILAKNAREQELGVLEKKQEFARRIHETITKFRKKSAKRMKRLESSNATTERKIVEDEVNILKHIDLDATEIETHLKKSRAHDLQPLLSKASIMSKIINAEERMGAINPAILKQFKMYEESILKKLEKSGIETVKRDEFLAIQELIEDLRKETIVLEQEFEKGRKTTKTRKRIQEVLAQRLMLENLLELARIEKLEDAKIKKNAIKIYDILHRINNLEQREEQILKK